MIIGTTENTSLGSLNEAGATASVSEDRPCLGGTQPIIPAGPNPGPVSRGGEEDRVDDFACSLCEGRSFRTAIGLGVHMRSAHPGEREAMITLASRKIRWTVEERRLMAAQEAAAVRQGIRFLNQHLTDLVPGRTLEAVKGVRKRADYKLMVQEYTEQPVALPPALREEAGPSRASEPDAVQAGSREGANVQSRWSEAEKSALVKVEVDLIRFRYFPHEVKNFTNQCRAHRSAKYIDLTRDTFILLTAGTSFTVNIRTTEKMALIVSLAQLSTFIVTQLMIQQRQYTKVAT
jgi:hypothetical protein